MERIKPLARFPIITTNLVEKAEFLLSQSIAEVEITRVSDRRCFQLEMNAVSLGRNSLNYNRFGADTEVIQGPCTDAIFFVTGRGVPTTIYYGNERHVISPQKTAIVASAKQIKIERPKNSEVLFLRVSSSDIWHHFEKLTARHHRGSLIFDRSLDMNNGPGAMLKRLMEYVINELEYNDLVMRNPDLRKSYDEILLNTLLALPHN